MVPNERTSEEVTCIRCLEEKEVQELDRLLWCEECQKRAQKRASTWGWVAGGALALLLALYIWFVIEPAADLIPTGWIAALVAAFYLGGRVSREIIFGAMRIRSRRAVEARPPPPSAGGASSEAE